MFREMDKRHAALLCQICGAQIPEKLPEKVVDLYWEFKRYTDPLSEGLTAKDLAWICFSAGVKKPVVEQPKVATVVDLVKAKKVKQGHPLIVTIGSEEHEAHLLRIMPSGEVSVKTVEGGNQYKLPADKVRVAELAEV